MIRDFKIIFGFLLIIVAGMIFFISGPRYVTYEPEVQGKITDENKQPVADAKIFRMEEKVIDHPEFKYDSVILYKSDSTISDKNGNFKFKNKSKIVLTWLMKYSNLCELNLEIEKEGYEVYRSVTEEWLIENEKALCNDTVLQPEITLKKINPK